jgi:hypothetical protein
MRASRPTPPAIDRLPRPPAGRRCQSACDRPALLGGRRDGREKVADPLGSIGLTRAGRKARRIRAASIALGGCLLYRRGVNLMDIGQGRSKGAASNGVDAGASISTTARMWCASSAGYGHRRHEMRAVGRRGLERREKRTSMGGRQRMSVPTSPPPSGPAAVGGTLRPSWLATNAPRNETCPVPRGHPGNVGSTTMGRWTDPLGRSGGISA